MTKTRTKTTTKTTKTSPYFKKEKVKKEEVKLEDEKKPINAKGVQDILQDDLKVLFVGINPGLTSAARGFHYAGPTNHFWPCLSASGLVDRKVTCEEDVELPARYRLGFTNLTARPSRKQSDLSIAEQREGIPLLNHKFETLRPRVACFIGKGMYEIYAKEKCSVLGLQPKEKNIKWTTGDGETVVFVMPSTSGLVTAYQKPDKIKFFQDLCKVAEHQDKLYPLYKIKIENE